MAKEAFATAVPDEVKDYFITFGLDVQALYPSVLAPPGAKVPARSGAAAAPLPAPPDGTPAADAVDWVSVAVPSGQKLVYFSSAAGGDLPVMTPEALLRQAYPPDEGLGRPRR